MTFEFFIALRYLLTRRPGQKVISIISVISVLGVTIGVGALIMVTSIMNGFSVDLRDKIIGGTPHVIVMSGMHPGLEDPARLAAIRSVSGVVAATPFIYSELMASTPSGVKGVIIRGIDPETAPAVIGSLRQLTAGSVHDLADPDGLPGVIIGKELAAHLQVSVGNRINLLSPSGVQSTTGFQPKIKIFRVVGIFSIDLYHYDSSLAYVSLDSARDLLGLPSGLVSGVDVAVNDIYAAPKIAGEILHQIGPPYYTRTWIDMNSNLFAALKMEKLGMSIILSLVVLVSSFSIVTALILLVMEKKRDIAVMMSMGATRQSIRKIFVLQGTIIGVVGAILGTAAGLGLCWFLSVYKLEILPKGVYSVDYLPILIDWADVILTAVGAVLLCYLATLYPASQAASVEPVTALRGE